MVTAINQGIEGTDLYVFSRSDDGSYNFFRPFELEEARQLADATNKLIAGYDAKGLRGDGLQVDEQTAEISNISTLRGILANRVLMQQTGGQSWLPAIGEGTLLQRAGLYRTGILIDHGLALYSAEDPDSEAAQALTEDAKKLGIESRPVFASFKSLDLRSGGERYGVIPQLDSAEGLYSGEEVQRLAEENRFILGDSGVRRLGYFDGWGAYWFDVLDVFGADCRVVGLSAVGDEKILSALVHGKVRQSCDTQRRLHQAKLSELDTREKATIESFEAILKPQS